MIAGVDKNQNESIEFGEFIDICPKAQYPKDELERAFKIFDKDSDGKLPITNLN